MIHVPGEVPCHEHVKWYTKFLHCTCTEAGRGSVEVILKLEISVCLALQHAVGHHDVSFSFLEKGLSSSISH